MAEELLTIKEAALLLGVSEQTLRRWDRSGKLRPRRHHGNRYRLYDKAQLSAWAARMRAAAAPATPEGAASGANGSFGPVLAPARTNLPRGGSAFIGRSAELERLGALLRGQSLVTLVGPPGIGKTRTALRWAELSGSALRAHGGVWYCDVLHAVTPAELCAAVSRALDRPTRDSVAPEAIEQEIARRGPLLLLIDNAEVLEPLARKLVGRWASSAPAARVLVTSRERLDVPGEVLFELGPLALPEMHEASADRLAAAEAVRLFCDRAAALGAEAEDLVSVAELCRALDGIPLAIELAAARSRVLAPRQILLRLGGLDLRGDGSSGGDRHATLRAAIDWSWQLLGEHEQSALAQCAVFAGGFTPEAAEEVIALAPGAPPVLEVLAALRDKSLLVLHASSSARARRFDLYATIAAFADERLAAAGARAGATLRHARYFLEQCGEWAEAVRVRSDPEARARLSSERDNLRALLERAAGERPPDAVRAVMCLEALLSTEGRNAEIEALAARAAPSSEAEAALDPDLLAKLLRVRGMATGTQGRLAEAIAALERAREMPLGEDAVRQATMGEVLTVLGVRYRQACRFDEAVETGARAVALLAGRQRLEGYALACLGLLLAELGRDEEARDKDLAARAVFRRLGDRWSEGLCLGNLAQLDQAAGRYEDAAARYASAVEAFGDDRVYAWVYRGFAASLAHERGDLERACAAYEEAVEALQRCRAAHVEGLLRGYLGAALAQLGEEARAITELDRAEALLAPVGAPALLAAVDVLRGQLDLARARRARATADAPGDEAALARARERLARATQGRPGGPSMAGSSQDVRFATRLLSRGLEQLDGPRRAADGLSIGEDALWFVVGAEGGGPRVSLARRGPLRRLLQALVRRRLDAPGEAIDRDALLAAGWPGERIQVEAGSRRVRVAVASLRSLGLRAVLLTRDDGYLLDPAISVRAARI